jgi:hypothetical protein
MGSRVLLLEADLRRPTIALQRHQPGALRPRRQPIRVDGHERVANVQQPERPARAETVRAREYTTRPQHPRHLTQQPILQPRRRHVVEHREAHHTREPPVRERHRGPAGSERSF